MYSDKEYISDDDNSDYIDDILCYQELFHSEIIERCDLVIVTYQMHGFHLTGLFCRKNI